jgi:phosphatidylglycerophosphate synthase
MGVIIAADKFGKLKTILQMVALCRSCSTIRGTDSIPIPWAMCFCTPPWF